MCPFKEAVKLTKKQMALKRANSAEIFGKELRLPHGVRCLRLSSKDPKISSRQAIHCVRSSTDRSVVCRGHKTTG